MPDYFLHGHSVIPLTTLADNSSLFQKCYAPIKYQCKALPHLYGLRVGDSGGIDH